MAYGKMCVICKRYTLVKIHTCRECLKNRINGLENRKYCNRCKTVKITSDFNKQSSRNDGLGDYCRECKREKDNNWFSMNPRGSRNMMLQINIHITEVVNNPP